MERGFAGRYGDLTTWHWWFRGRARILDRVLARELAGAATPRAIASIGSGPAEGLGWVAAHAGEGGLVVGEDGDPSGALRAAGAGGRRPPGTAFVVAAAGRSALRARAFDAVLALDVLEHLDDDAAALADAARLAKPGGLLLVTVPAGPSLWTHHDEVNGHKRRYTRRTLAGAFARAGLLHPRLRYFNTLLLPPIAALRWTRRLTGRQADGSDFDDGRPGLANDLLAAIFSTERHLIGRIRLPLGVSLLATLRAGSRSDS